MRGLRAYLAKELYNLAVWLAPRETQLHIAYSNHRKIEDVLRGYDLYPNFYVTESKIVNGEALH